MLKPFFERIAKPMKPTSENGCRRFRAATFLIAVLLSLSFMPQASWADLYSGSLNAGADGGLVGTEPWNSTDTILTWKVTSPSDSGPQYWTYNYKFTVPEKAISHVITQVSETFVAESNIKDGTTPGYNLGTYGPDKNGKSNPGMPSTYKGLKWGASGFTFSWTIVTDRAPMLGSFYAKDGQDSGNWVYAYTEGDLIGVPDSTSTVPLPPSALLLGSGLLSLLGVKAGLLRGRGRVSRKRNRPSQASY